MRPHAAALKALLDEPRLQIMPGCGDGMGAHLIEEAGFRTGFISGSSISAMRLAMPDMDLVSFGEMADAVETCIAAAPNVLWLADGDTGHGNALAVQKVIRTYARRGAAAVLIEDKIWPRPLGHGGAKLVIDRDAAVLRCRAAVEACRDEGILLLARTDARVSRGFDEALARIQAFVAEGAHILFLDSPQSEDEIRAGIAACNGRPALAVTSPAGKHFIPGNAELGAGAHRHPNRCLPAGHSRRERTGDTCSAWRPERRRQAGNGQPRRVGNGDPFGRVLGPGRALARSALILVPPPDRDWRKARR
jgi:2-methylisocitrate lyase-like PEP mutase family enzyme